MEGLEETISPSRAWEIARSGIEGFTDATIQNHLRTFGIAVVRHKQLAASYNGDVFDEDSSLLHFVCSVHGARSEAGEILSIEQFTSLSCLALAMWDSLYYALIAEVRCQYEVTTKLDRNQILHKQGSSGDATDRPFTVNDLHVLLRNIWSFLVDPRLLGPLETAVRTHEVAESYRKADVDHDFRQTFQQVWQGYSTREKEEILDRTQGMLDAARMSVDNIEVELRQHVGGRVRRACIEELKIPIPSGEQEEDTPIDDIEKWPQLESPPPTEENPCCCPPICGCRLVCQYSIHECQCKTTTTETARRDAQSVPEQSSSSPPARGPARARTNTTGSQQSHGVYQHPRRQQGKQVFPTEFYAEQRGSGRYPRFTASSPQPSSSPPPTTTPLPSQPDQNVPRAAAEASRARPSFSGRRLVVAGGDLPLSEREVFPDDYLPQPEEHGWAMTKEEFEALPAPRRPSEAGPPLPSRRRPSWVKRVFSRSHSYSQ